MAAGKLLIRKGDAAGAWAHLRTQVVLEGREQAQEAVPKCELWGAVDVVLHRQGQQGLLFRGMNIHVGRVEGGIVPPTPRVVEPGRSERWLGEHHDVLCDSTNRRTFRGPECADAQMQATNICG